MKVYLLLAAAVLVASTQGARIPRAANGKYDAVLEELREVVGHLKEGRQPQEPAGQVAEAREVQDPQEFETDNSLRSEEDFDIPQEQWNDPHNDLPMNEWDDPQAAVPQREWDNPHAAIPQRGWDDPQEWADPDPVGADTYRQGYQEDIPGENSKGYQEEVPVEGRKFEPLREDADPYEPVAADDIPYEQRRRNMADNDHYRREEETEVQYASDEDPFAPVAVDEAPQYGDQPKYGQDMGPVNDLEETEGEYINSDPGQQEAEDLSPQEREYEPMPYKEPKPNGRQGEWSEGTPGRGTNRQRSQLDQRLGRKPED